MEDDHDLRHALVDLLRNAGHEVSEAADGDLALMVLRGRPIDVLLIDLTLPTLNGEWVIKFTEASHTMPNHPRVIVLTGSTDTAQERLAGLTVEQVIFKPFEVPELLAAITQTEQPHGQ